MTDEERKDEAAEDTIEDLDAPADPQEDVAGGAGIAPSRRPSASNPTCVDTVTRCIRMSLQKEQHLR